VKALAALGFKVAHHYDSRFSDPGTRGFPDLTVVGHGHCWFDELKRWDGVVHDDQAAWHEHLRYADQNVYVWRPQDWDVMLQRAEGIAKQAIPEELTRFPEPRKRPKRKRQASSADK